MPALISGRYHVKWTKLADLPAPLYCAYVAVQYNKVYVAGGHSSVDDAMDQVYMYDIITDKWSQLPPSGHYYCIPHIIGGKLAIIGGRLFTTKKRTNKVSTFDEESQTWMSYYPDLLSVRSAPGVVSHVEHVIVAGGARDDIKLAQDDIEVLNWIENSHWRKVAIKLPVPMWGFTPTISDDHLYVIGYCGIDLNPYNDVYKIPVVNITKSINDHNNMQTKWTRLTKADHWETALLPNSFPPVVVGGMDATGTTTADIKMYTNSNKSWKKIGLLSFSRASGAVVPVYNNAIIIIGGYTKGDGVLNAKSSSLTVVELGQAELLH